MNFKLPKDLGDAIAAYLQERPYKEVTGLLNGIMQLEALPEESPPVPTKEIDEAELDK